MLSIGHGVPMVVAGVHEGKNEINARVGYFKLGANLKTETPSSADIKSAVLEVVAQGEYKANVGALQAEFRKYRPERLTEKYIYEALGYKLERHVMSVEA